MIKSGISQDEYPKKIVIGKDTLCVITIPQLDSANKSFVDGDKCNEEKDSLNSQIKNYEILTSGQEKVIQSQDKEIGIQKIITAEKDTIIQESDKIHKRMHRQIKWLRIQRNVFAGASAILTILIIL